MRNFIAYIFGFDRGIGLIIESKDIKEASRVVRELFRDQHNGYVIEPEEQELLLPEKLLRRYGCVRVDATEIIKTS